MDTHRWRRVRQLFEDALALPSADRENFLDRSCGDDPSVRREVDSMLRSHDSLGRFLEPPEDLHPDSGHHEPDPLPGTRAGPYRIAERLGEGGMGTVYRGVRDYGQYQKVAAVKFIRRQLQSGEALARFEQEQESLARLDHPYIARLLDSGHTDAGLPYVVMEYVEGVPIDVYCNGQSLSVRDRLLLFQKVCSAVRFAHERLIVHCDLKPGNILVTDEGTPRLLDFGIAMILDRDRRPGADQNESDGIRFITLEYASPERVRGEGVTTASDVYSLGVLLYRLLTGRGPYRFEHRLPHEMAKAICEQEPDAPSRVSDTVDTSRAAGGTGPAGDGKPDRRPGGGRRALAGDLDAIVLKALRKDPATRYSSVEQLSEDVRRHLEGLPVTAREQTPLYRTSRFIRRHRAGAVTVAAVVLAVAAGVAGVLWQANQTRLQAEKAERISVFLEEMLSAADPAKSSKDFTVIDALSRAAERAERELSREPVALATVFFTIGRTFNALEQYERAEPYIRRSLELRRTLFGPNSPEVAECLLLQAEIEESRREFSAADSLFKRAADMLEEAGTAGRPVLAQALDEWGWMKILARKTDSAAVLCSTAVAMYGKLPEPDPDKSIRATQNLAIVRTLQGNMAATESLYAVVLAYWSEHGDGHELDVANTMNNYAFVLLARGDSAGAESYFRSSTDARRRIYGADHPAYARDLMNLGSLLAARRRFTEAEPVLTEALPLLRKGGTPDLRRLAHTLKEVGYVRNQTGRFAEAEAPLREAMVLQRELLPPGDPRMATWEYELGYSLAGQRRYAEAEPLLLDAWALAKSANGPDSPQSKNALAKLASLYAAWGKPAKARALPQ